MIKSIVSLYIILFQIFIVIINCKAVQLNRDCINKCSIKTSIQLDLSTDQCIKYSDPCNLPFHSVKIINLNYNNNNLNTSIQNNNFKISIYRDNKCKNLIIDQNIECYKCNQIRLYGKNEKDSYIYLNCNNNNQTSSPIELPSSESSYSSSDLPTSSPNITENPINSSSELNSTSNENSSSSSYLSSSSSSSSSESSTFSPPSSSSSELDNSLPYLSSESSSTTPIVLNQLISFGRDCNNSCYEKTTGVNQIVINECTEYFDECLNNTLSIIIEKDYKNSNKFISKFYSNRNCSGNEIYSIKNECNSCSIISDSKMSFYTIICPSGDSKGGLILDTDSNSNSSFKLTPQLLLITINLFIYIFNFK